MMKVAMIGAGSIVFAKTLLNDMLATPEEYEEARRHVLDVAQRVGVDLGA